jgi:hypothetical protein
MSPDVLPECARCAALLRFCNGRCARRAAVVVFGPNLWNQIGSAAVRPVLEGRVTLLRNVGHKNRSACSAHIASQIDCQRVHAGLDTGLLVLAGRNRSDVRRAQRAAQGPRWGGAVPAVHDAGPGSCRRWRGGQSSALAARCCQGRPPAPSPGRSFQAAIGSAV